MENKKITLILGAGFSFPAKLPIQDLLIEKLIAVNYSSDKEFLDINIDNIESRSDETSVFLFSYIEVVFFLLKVFYDDDCEKLKNDFNKIKQKYYESDFGIAVDKHSIYFFDKDRMYRDLLPIKNELRMKLEESINTYSKVSFEDIFTILDMSIINKTKINSYHYTKLINIKNSLLFLFIYYFNIDLENINNYYDKYNSIFDFIEKNKENISIITTNWDILTELFLKKRNLEYSHCFNNRYVNNNKKIKKIDKKTTIPIIKIHGSMDWFSCISCNEITTVNYSNNNNFIYDNYQDISCKKCNNKNQMDETLLLPQIITPTMVKTFNSQLFVNLWKTASDVLVETNHLIFVGYSFPTADYEFRYLLKKNINNNTKITVILIDSDNPKKIDKKINVNLLPEYRYKSLFIRQKPDFNYNGFEKYFDNLT